MDLHMGLCENETEEEYTLTPHYLYFTRVG